MRSNPSLHHASMTASILVSKPRVSSTAPSSPSNRLALIGAHAQHTSIGVRHHFARTALFSAVASVLVGVGMASASAAETDPRAEVAQSPTASNPQVEVQNNSQSTSQTNVAQDGSDDSLIDFDSEAELDAALEALRLRRDFEQGEVDKSVLDEFSEEVSQDGDMNTSEINTGTDAENNNSNEADVSPVSNNDFDSDAELQRQATAIQQQGYQMMTPEQIDRELAALDAENDSFMESTSNGNTEGLDDVFDAGFNAPIARLDSQRLPLGLDPKIDSATLPTPNNLETLNRAQTPEEQAQTAEIMARPIEVSDSVSSGRVDDGADITEQNNPEQILAQQDNRSVTGVMILSLKHKSRPAMARWLMIKTVSKAAILILMTICQIIKHRTMLTPSQKA